MKPIIKTVISSLAATTAMTLFSYAVSDHEKENFREPDLLATFIGRTCGVGKEASQPMGWASHYLIGAGFAIAYLLFFKNTNLKSSVKNGILFGGGAGLVGILSWETLFQTHSAPPRTNKKEFYAQLMVAHIIFATTLALFKNNRKL
ncbi:hypothetical protein L0657_22145 [Dyadobacter sp. CY345]|uniref:hypothetical protein n=1 Tax=Dyadobacter sp. CY345 TaxID=2909335 RepID=UPI001F3714E7|nr:hypothetical protein [Dyadobacter sp. CY345]MCF2446675.1 hypothetical protein [Dyadobacter sp. CY345]